MSGVGSQASGIRSQKNYQPKQAISRQLSATNRSSPFVLCRSLFARRGEQAGTFCVFSSEKRMAKSEKRCVSKTLPATLTGSRLCRPFPKRNDCFQDFTSTPRRGVPALFAIRCSLFARRQSPRLLRRKANGEWRKASKNRSLARRGGLVMTNIR